MSLKHIKQKTPPFLMTKNKKTLLYCWENFGFYSFQLLYILEKRTEKKFHKKFRR